MEAWKSIQDTIEYIEEHYQEELSVEVLSRVAHLSEFYYQRLFYRLVNKTVGEYIKLRRLEKAAVLLKQENTSILEVAVACGFNSHAHFTRVFKQVYGLTPDYYRNHSISLDHFVKPNLLLKYTMIDIGVPIIVEDMVLEINEQYIEEDQIYIGQSKQAPITELEQPKINILKELWNTIEVEENQIGVDILTPVDQNTFDYFVGIYSEVVKENKETRIMPKGKYIVCTYDAKDFETLVSSALTIASKYVYEVWLPNKQITPDSFLMQKYIRPFSETCCNELWAKVIE